MNMICNSMMAIKLLVIFIMSWNNLIIWIEFSFQHNENSLEVFYHRTITN